MKKSPLHLPHLLRSYRKLLITCEKNGWNIFEKKDDYFGIYLFIDLPDDKNYWKIHKNEILEDLHFLNRYKKLKKITKKMK